MRGVSWAVMGRRRRRRQRRSLAAAASPPQLFPGEHGEKGPRSSSARLPRPPCARSSNRRVPTRGAQVRCVTRNVARGWARGRWSGAGGRTTGRRTKKHRESEKLTGARRADGGCGIRGEGREMREESELSAAVGGQGGRRSREEGRANLVLSLGARFRSRARASLFLATHPWRRRWRGRGPWLLLACVIWELGEKG